MSRQTFEVSISLATQEQDHPPADALRSGPKKKYYTLRAPMFSQRIDAYSLRDAFPFIFGFVEVRARFRDSNRCASPSSPGAAFSGEMV